MKFSKKINWHFSRNQSQNPIIPINRFENHSIAPSQSRLVLQPCLPPGSKEGHAPSVVRCPKRRPRINQFRIIYHFFFVVSAESSLFFQFRSDRTSGDLQSSFFRTDIVDVSYESAIHNNQPRIIVRGLMRDRYIDIHRNTFQCLSMKQMPAGCRTVGKRNFLVLALERSCAYGSNPRNRPYSRMSSMGLHLNSEATSAKLIKKSKIKVPNLGTLKTLKPVQASSMPESLNDACPERIRIRDCKVNNFRTAWAGRSEIFEGPDKEVSGRISTLPQSPSRQVESRAGRIDPAPGDPPGGNEQRGKERLNRTDTGRRRAQDSKLGQLLLPYFRRAEGRLRFHVSTSTIFSDLIPRNIFRIREISRVAARY
ncbi:unnamed protein product [Nesidiocoris tenuis]|uniref:Uncharacterized protein n=1 Tax=Nesidiocoris tenuis TaxID=355587 RepID=A0A6H5GVQ4_9HEMI|nr:unnamed protein product [Nesidiocoris tenuis]